MSQFTKNRCVFLAATVLSVVSVGCAKSGGGDKPDRLILVSPISGATTEAGGQASFSVVLNAKPSADVTVNFASSNSAEGTVGAGSLTFTPENFDAPQSVTVTGVDDDIADGAQTYAIAFSATTTDDKIYAELTPADVAVVNVDDDSAGITTTPVSGATTEAGGTASFSLVLNSEPTADVTVSFDTDDLTEGTPDVQGLTFTPVNWAAPQVVTITGVGDDLADGSQTFNIVFSGISSADTEYAALSIPSVPVTNIDDDTAGITVGSPTGPTTESGGAAQFSVILNSEPTADVTVSFSSSDTGEGTLNATSLTFTTTNWATAQTVTASGVNDDVADGNQLYSVVFGATVSGDAAYAALVPGNVGLTNIDNDSAGITVSSLSAPTSEPAKSSTFTVVLNSEPLADVGLSFASSDTSEAKLAPGNLTFTAANWDMPQTVTATGVDDALIDGDQPFAVIFSPATSADADYNGITPANLSSLNLDNDETKVVAVFADTIYVDYIPGNATAEASNVEATLVDLDHIPTTFTGVTAADFDNALANRSVLAIPEQEIAALDPALDSAARTVIVDFVDLGGTLFAFGDLNGRAVALLNSNFGFSFVQLNPSADLALTPESAGTLFEGGPATLPLNSATLGLDEASLPVDATSLYSDGAGSSGLTQVPFGSGNIFFVGWDWYDAAPTGITDGGWLTVLGTAMFQPPFDASIPPLVFNFDDGLQGWTVNTTSATVTWNADGAPSPVAGVDDAFVSAPFSLNYNDDVDFDSGSTNSGSATSPPIDLSAAPAPILTIECNYQTETTGTTYDQRFVRISNDGFATTLVNDQLSTDGVPLGGACASMGTWHTHSYTLDPTWGAVEIRFFFDTIDGIGNTGDGWFLDDVTVSGL